jgi:uncharacterized membrane protein
MSLDHKLGQWQDAGLIDAPTRERIAAFEASRRRPIMLYALGGLGALTLGIGIVSVVASNWDAIDKRVKLGADLALCGALAFGLDRAVARAQTWLCDVLVGVYYALAIASIALLGQIYQTGAPLHEALLVWSLGTAPLMLLAHGRFLGSLWITGLLVTHGLCLQAWLEQLGRGRDLDDLVLANLAITSVFGSAIVYLSLARVSWFVRQRPWVSAAWTDAVWSVLAVGAFALGFLWYVDINSRDRLTWGVASTGALSLALIALLPRLYPELTARARHGAAALLAFAWLVLATGATFPHAELPAVGAVAQVIVLGLCAFTVLALGRVRTFNALTGLIALRVLVMYFEVFGSMLSTGLGMITGGLLTLALAWLWKRKSPELAARLGTVGGSHAA